MIVQDRPNAGERPAPIDIEGTLGADAPKLAQVEAEFEEGTGAPEPPAYQPGSFGVVAKGGLTKAVQSNALDGTSDSTTTVPEYIRGTLEQLHGIQRYLHGRDVNKLSRNQVRKITKELFDYQYKDMQHVLMLGMDIQKKERFIQYLEATKPLQNRIQRGSADAQRAVIDTMFECRQEAFEGKNRRDAELADLHRKGVLTTKQYEMNKQDNETLTDAHIKRLDDTVALLLSRHAEFLFRTLELFKATLIKNEIV